MYKRSKWVATVKSIVPERPHVLLHRFTLFNRSRRRPVLPLTGKHPTPASTARSLPVSAHITFLVFPFERATESSCEDVNVGFLFPRTGSSQITRKTRGTELQFLGYVRAVPVY